MNGMDEKKAKVIVGTAGWDYPDWRGLFYPKRMPTGMHPLTYLASYFGVVEVNSTFYRPCRPEHAARWLEHVETKKDFSFTVKLWQRFTHERVRFPGKADAALFKEGVAPLAGAGRLGGLLVQFPWSFRNLPENHTWLDRVLDCFAEYPMALEVRHAGWNTPEFHAYLQKRRVGICNIDQPLFHDSLAPSDRVTARLGYVRLHGQNHADWFRPDAGRDARYDYLYSDGELEPWVEKIRAMQKQVERLYVITNNHYRGQAAVNGLQLAHKIQGKKLAVPPTLETAYPQLAGLRAGRGPGEQKNLPGF
jgi:uncharacterized protein YecE (DUF72 family)